MKKAKKLFSPLKRGEKGCVLVAVENRLKVKRTIQ